MTPRTNPFTPTFGMVPPYLAGRDRVLATMRDAFHAGLGNPNLCSLFIGPRGSGKTALLSCIGDEAREAGWIVVDTVAEEGMLEDIIQHATLEAAQVVDASPHSRLSGLTVGQHLKIGSIIHWATFRHLLLCFPRAGLDIDVTVH